VIVTVGSTGFTVHVYVACAVGDAAVAGLLFDATTRSL